MTGTTLDPYSGRLATENSARISETARPSGRSA